MRKVKHKIEGGDLEQAGIAGSAKVFGFGCVALWELVV
jgi:hypothetical protein